jgi:hypothetical protein
MLSHIKYPGTENGVHVEKLESVYLSDPMSVDHIILNI